MSALVWLAIGLAVVLSSLVWRIGGRARKVEEELSKVASFCVLTSRYDRTGEHRTTLRLLVETVSLNCPRFAKLTADVLQDGE